MKKLLPLLALLALVSPAQAAEEVVVCALPNEFQALNMRALQSELMVAALSCSQNREYNWFAKTYKKQLTGYGTDIIGFFTRYGATDGEKLLNDFITKMANHASRASLGRPQPQYCGEVATLYAALHKGEFQRVESLANRFYPGWHRVPLCKKS